MKRSLCSSAVIFSALGLLTSLAGCGDPVTSISGTATYNGQPIPRGAITINPADGRGKGEGAKIVDGVYEVKPIAPGSKIVSVMGSMGGGTAAVAPTSSEDKMKIYGDKNGSDSTEIPRNAVGQGQTIEIKEGAQTHDFEFTSPPGGKRRR